MEFTPRCPICRSAARWDGNPHRPFCSERCKQIDLGAWAEEKFVIPGAAPTDPLEDPLADE